VRLRLTDRRTQAWAVQVASGVILAAIAALVVQTLLANLARLNLSAGFGFLARPAGMQIAESVVSADASDSFAWVIFAAALNTVRVAACAVVLATLLGTAVGTMRLSSNPLLRTITAVYVELFRNTPLLLQVIFWAAVMLRLPGVREAINLGGWIFLSQRGLQMPALAVQDGLLGPVLAAAAACGAVATLAARRRGPSARLAAFFVAFVIAGLVALAVQGRLELDRPVRKLLGYSGGMVLTPEFCALLVGLVAYAGAFIAEIVRGGILAVPQGQWEAARSLGLRDATILRRVVLPQAIRVILPPLTSQYVGIIKNSSLAIAIGYPDLFWAISSAINVTGHAIEGVVLLMLAYLLLTLSTAGVMNTWYARLLRRGTT